MRPLLLLVDLQLDFLAARDLEPPAGELVASVARLLAGCRRSAIPVAHLRTTVAREPDRRMPHWRERDDWRCLAGTPGHEPPPELAALAGEPILDKTGFNGFAGGALAKLLRDGGFDTLILAGLHLHACVRQTALDAHGEGLAVWIAEDAVASDDPLHAAATRRWAAERSLRFAPSRELLARLADAAPAEATAADRAAAAVDRAAAAWVAGEVDLESRCRWLDDLADRLAERAGELAELLVAEIGKPIRFARAEVDRSAELLRAVARRARRATADERLRGAELRRRPHGVVAAVTPWNNPLYIPLGKLAPALAFGNAVVWKPAPETPRIARTLAALHAAAGVPADRLALAEGEADVGAALLADPRVAAASLTGSSAAGWRAQEICGRRRIPLQAELGGNNGALVWRDADLATAAREVAAGAFEMAGQRCTANRRVVVLAERHDELVAALAAAAAELPWGDPASPATRIGPVIDERRRERIAEAVERAVADGWRAITPHGVAPPDRHRAWSPPTILIGDDPDAEIVREETFGPLLVVLPARSWEEAMARLNGVRQGLAAALFTRSPDLVERFLAEARAGILKIGRSTADAEVDVPFGGWGASALGPPEHGEFDREFYTRPQVVYRAGTPG